MSEERLQLQVAIRTYFENVRDQAHDLAGRETRTRRAFCDLAALDLTDIMVPSDRGGSGGCLRDLALVCSEAGRALFEGPLGSTAAAAVVVRHCSPTEGVGVLTQGLASGERIVTISDGVTVGRSEVDGSLVMEGTARFVPDADVADRLLVLAVRPQAGRQVVLVDVACPGLSISAQDGIGPHRPCQVRFEGLALADCSEVGSLDNPSPFLADMESSVAVAVAAEATGAAERVMEIAVDYAGHRTQFGRPIGSFQATQFRCVDLLIDVEAMRCATARAAEAFDIRLPEYHRLALGAAAYAADGFVRVVAGAHRVLGANGFSAAGPLGSYTRAAEAVRSTCGPRQLRRRLAAELDRRPEETAVSGVRSLPVADVISQQILYPEGNAR